MNPSPCAPILVMKFGGAALSSTSGLLNAARIVIERATEGFRPVVVVSAMGRETDRLLSLAREVSTLGAPDLELDTVLAAGEQVSAGLFALALRSRGHDAKSLLAHQLPLLTDGRPGDARIVHVETRELLANLLNGMIPVVAGFQGVTASGRIVTLGRGGSDTTAVAIAGALRAYTCEFYKDVDGVYTMDPKQEPEAVKFDVMTYSAMSGLADRGAKVLHGKAVSLAESLKVPLHVRSAFVPRTEGGTWIGPLPQTLTVKSGEAYA